MRDVTNKRASGLNMPPITEEAQPKWDPLSEIYICGPLPDDRGRCYICHEGVDYSDDPEVFEEQAVDLFECSVECWAYSCHDCTFACWWCDRKACQWCFENWHCCEPMQRHNAARTFVTADITTAVATAPVVQSFVRHRMFDRYLVKSIFQFM